MISTSLSLSKDSSSTMGSVTLSQCCWKTKVSSQYGHCVWQVTLKHILTFDLHCSFVCVHRYLCYDLQKLYSAAFVHIKYPLTRTIRCQSQSHPLLTTPFCLIWKSSNCIQIKTTPVSVREHAAHRIHPNLTIDLLISKRTAS
jgi:hypothetical protein